MSGYRGGLIWWQSPKANIPLGNGIHAQTQADPEIPKLLISIANNNLSKIFSNILSKKQPNIKTFQVANYLVYNIIYPRRWRTKKL